MLWLVLFLFLLLIYIGIIYNIFVKMANKVDEAFATMDVYLKKRWDLIPSLVEAVKGYMKYEKDTLQEIVKIRNNVYDDLSSDEKINVNEKLNKLFLLMENYPELKASDNTLSLINQLAKVEDEIASSRKYYNAIVRLYNNKVEIFPNNIVAKILGFKVKLMFTASETEKDNIKIGLG